MSISPADEVCARLLLVTVAESGGRRLKTVMFSDVEGSTRLLRRAGDRYAELLHRHRTIVREEIARSGGEEQGTEGDSFYVLFDSPSGACAAALAIQRRLIDEPWPPDCEIRVRVGLHTGEIEFRDGWVGMAIHEAARVGAAPHGGQTVVSETVRDLVADRLPGGAEFSDLGRHLLKDIEEPVRLYQLNHPDLEAEFPPLRTLSDLRLANNLPCDVSTFVGRERELSELRQLIASSRLVTLTGAGGSGKTRLALQVGADLLDGSGDGVWLVELASVNSPDSVASTVANVLGVRENPARSMVDVLVEALSERSMLLILDNCEHVVGATAKLVDALLRSAAGIIVLATSREALQIDGEQVYLVPSLSVPGSETEDPEVICGSESVRLLVERAAQHRAAFVVDETNAIAAAAVCRRLDGIPLAIELAAARLRTLSLDDLERRLDKRFQILTGGSRVALPRHKTLRGLIDWSWDLLTGPEQMVLSRVSVFAGGFDLAAAEAAAPGKELEEFSVLDLLGALVDKSLLQADDSTGTVRYRLLESVRHYAADKLAEDGRDVERAQCAHRDYYLSLAEEAKAHLSSKDQLAWLDRLDVEHGNISAALARSSSDADPVPGLRLATALRQFWKARGYLSEGIDAIKGGLDRLPADAPLVLRGEALANLAQLLGQVGSGREATVLAKQARVIACDLDDQRLVADTLWTQAFVESRQGDPQAALPLVEEGLAIARAVADDHLSATLLSMRALARDVLEDHQGAVSDTAECLKLYRRVGDQRLVGGMLGNLGYGELSLGHIGAARSHLTEALQIAREMNDPKGIIIATFNLAIAAYLEGHDDEAEALFAEALSRSRHSPMKADPAYALVGVALTMSRLGQERQAAVLHGAADAAFEILGQAMVPLEAGLHKRDVAKLQTDLGRDAFTSAYTEGREMPFDEVMALALA
jgi:predicted ATPase/class 3 adenylate cyclase